MNSKIKNDCVWVYRGGESIDGEWTSVQEYISEGRLVTLPEIRDQYEAKGFPCVYGRISIGAPEGPPR